MSNFKIISDEELAELRRSTKERMRKAYMYNSHLNKYADPEKKEPLRIVADGRDIMDLFQTWVTTTYPDKKFQFRWYYDMDDRLKFEAVEDK